MRLPPTSEAIANRDRPDASEPDRHDNANDDPAEAASSERSYRSRPQAPTNVRGQPSVLQIRSHVSKLGERAPASSSRLAGAHAEPQRRLIDRSGQCLRDLG
jgi:hypothetical protein